MIENFSSRVLQKWGLGYDELCSIKPDIVYVSMSGYGHTGRNHHYTTFGPVAQAASGLTHLSGLPDKPPAGWGWSYMDDTGGMYGAMCALTGLYHRNMTGQGQHIDLSQMVSSVPLNGPALLDFTVNGRGSRAGWISSRQSRALAWHALVNNYRGPTVAPHNAYRTHPGEYNDWCVIVCHSDEEWRRLVQVMGAPVVGRDAEVRHARRTTAAPGGTGRAHRNVEHDARKVRADGALPGSRRARPSGAERRRPGGT